MGKGDKKKESTDKLWQFLEKADGGCKISSNQQMVFIFFSKDKMKSDVMVTAQSGEHIDILRAVSHL